MTKEEVKAETDRLQKEFLSRAAVDESCIFANCPSCKALLAVYITQPPPVDEPTPAD